MTRRAVPIVIVLLLLLPTALCLLKATYVLRGPANPSIYLTSERRNMFRMLAKQELQAAKTEDVGVRCLPDGTVANCQVDRKTGTVLFRQRIFRDFADYYVYKDGTVICKSNFDLSFCRCSQKICIGVLLVLIVSLFFRWPFLTSVTDSLIGFCLMINLWYIIVVVVCISVPLIVTDGLRFYTLEKIPFEYCSVYGKEHAGKSGAFQDPACCERRQADRVVRILKKEDRRAASRRVQGQHDDAVRTIGGGGAYSAADAPVEGFQRLSEKVPAKMSAAERAQMASDKNQVMDELLNQPVIPGDYGAQMIALFRDQKQDVVTRDFAVQHMGLYAQTLNRRGTYSPDSAEARALRSALDEAVGETKTIVSAAAFRALADIAAFDPHVDGRRLDARLAACVADSAAAPAARVMAAQLCGERRIASARPMLAALAADPAAPETLRRSAAYAVSLLDAK